MTQRAQLLNPSPRTDINSMRVSLRVAMAAFVLAAVTSAPASAASDNPLINGVNGPSKWLHDYGQGRRLARDLGLPLIVHFHASWCGPCQQMERETLSSKQLLGQFGHQIIGVKIDSDEEPDLVEAFRVDALPCDIVIAPDGLIVERNSGYQSRSAYLATVAKMSGQFREERAAAIARLQPPAQPLPTAEPDRPAARPNPQSTTPDSRALASGSGVPRPGSRPAQPQERPAVQLPVPQPSVPLPPAARPMPPASSSPLVGLDGYCPVHIQTRREWIKGNPQYSVTWQGVVYNLASAEDLRTFQSAPQKFAPRMLGCDPVALWTTERAVQGSVEYGAFFNGDLFLFVSSESRNQFKVNPSRYVQLRHAFHADDVVGTRIR